MTIDKDQRYSRTIDKEQNLISHRPQSTANMVNGNRKQLKINFLLMETWFCCLGLDEIGDCIEISGQAAVEKTKVHSQKCGRVAGSHYK